METRELAAAKSLKGIVGAVVTLRTAFITLISPQRTQAQVAVATCDVAAAVARWNRHYAELGQIVGAEHPDLRAVQLPYWMVLANCNRACDDADPDRSARRLRPAPSVSEVNEALDLWNVRYETLRREVLRCADS